ncbi:hypothetical protein, partial [Paenibacillus apiarius]|uniref:hypothetical protein n=1 Tax=Paenibacillus apiarius TaxID=46240 RepID=UPI003B3A20C2
NVVYSTDSFGQNPFSFETLIQDLHDQHLEEVEAWLYDAALKYGVMEGQVMKVGLIKGRHPLPVGKYLLESAEFETAYTSAFEAMNELAKSHNGDIDLYLTGLTRAALGAIEGWREANTRIIKCFSEDYTKTVEMVNSELPDLNVYEFNAASGQYECKIRYRTGGRSFPTYGGLADDVIEVYTWGEVLKND